MVIVVARYAKGLDESVRRAMMTDEMRSVCFLFSETGTEGVWWTMRKDGFVREDGHWKY